MGGCVPMKWNPDQWDGDYIDSIEVPDVFQDQKHIEFHLSISNIKLKPIKLVTHSNQPGLTKIQIEVDSIKFQTEDAKVPTVGSFRDTLRVIKFYQWKYKKQADFSTSKNDLKRSSVKFFVRNNGKQIAKLRINTYKVCVGPYHHDFQLHTVHEGQVKKSRLSFDLRINQKIEFHISPINIQINLHKRFSQFKYFYGMKLLDHQHNFINSQISQPCANSYYDDKMNQETDQAHKIIWNYGNKQTNGGSPENQIPELDVVINTHEIHYANFQVMLWSEQPIGSKKELKIQNSLMNLNFVAQCYISFSQIFDCNIQGVLLINQKYDKDNKVYEVRKKQLRKKMWDHGISIGEAKLKFVVKNCVYLHQMNVGIHTQRGLQKSVSIYSTSQISSKNCEQINQLSKLKQQLQQLIYTLDSVCSVAQNRRTLQNLYQVLKNISSLLSKQNTINSFTYKNQQDMIKGQTIIIQIGTILLQYADLMQGSPKQKFYQLLKIIINRGELRLSYLGFKQTYSNFKYKQEIIIQTLSIHKKKIQVGLKYQQFLTKALQQILQKLSIKALCQEQRKFIENMCAVCYFEVSRFQKQLLSCIKKEGDEKYISQLMQERLKKKSHHFDKIHSYQLALYSLFDWNEHFFYYLKQQQKSKANQNKITQILQKQQWKKSMSKRGVAFFFFLSFWSEYAQKTVITPIIPWSSIPGYWNLISSFLVQLQERQISQYPEALKQTIVKLLSNTKLLQIYIHIFFQRTKVLDVGNVISTLNLINSCLQYLLHHKKHLPNTFNFSFFLRGLKRLLNGEHEISLAKVMWILYCNYNLFPLHFKRDIAVILLGRNFLRFYTHWSNNVRRNFLYLLIYRVFHESRSEEGVGIENGQNAKVIVSEFNQNGEIRQYYNKVMEVVHKCQGIYDSNQMYQKLPLYKRMQFKLQLRKKKQTVKSKDLLQLQKILEELELKFSPLSQSRYFHQEQIQLSRQPSSPSIQTNIRNLNSGRKNSSITENSQVQMNSSSRVRKFSFHSNNQEKEQQFQLSNSLVKSKSKQYYKGQYLRISHQNFKGIIKEYKMWNGKTVPQIKNIQLPNDQIEINSQHQEW